MALLYISIDWMPFLALSLVNADEKFCQKNTLKKYDLQEIYNNF